MGLAWYTRIEETGVLLKALAALQLVKPMGQAGAESYVVHWLVRDFAQSKARDWSWWQRLRFARWPWRYRLGTRLRWWWPSLPRPEPGVSWPWWSSKVPGTEDVPGYRSILTWLLTTLWRRGVALNLSAGPDEWGIVVRLSARFALLAGVGWLAMLVAYARVLLHDHLPLGGLVVQILATWGVIVAYTDLRRAVLLWGVEEHQLKTGFQVRYLLQKVSLL